MLEGTRGDMAEKKETILTMDSLSVEFPSAEGLVRASNGVNLTIRTSERWCLVGESGCGKTMVAMSLLKLLPPSARVSGQVYFRGRDLLSLSEKEMRRIRGREISIIFEQPGAFLNPVFPVGDQIAEAVRVHGRLTRRQARDKTLSLLEQTGLPEPEKRYRQYPHQLSGGMNQRVMIAMALAFKPSLLIADEPTTALDLTVQAQIIDLLHRLMEESGTTLLLISHDYEMAAELCDHVAVMYAGTIVETGTEDKVFKRPGHPYTRAMLAALDDDRPQPIPGQVPALSSIPAGCPFHPRCREAKSFCHENRPKLKDGVRCHLH